MKPYRLFKLGRYSATVQLCRHKTYVEGGCEQTWGWSLTVPFVPRGLCADLSLHAGRYSLWFELFAYDRGRS